MRELFCGGGELGFDDVEHNARRLRQPAPWRNRQDRDGEFAILDLRFAIGRIPVETTLTDPCLLNAATFQRFNALTL